MNHQQLLSFLRRQTAAVGLMLVLQACAHQDAPTRATASTPSDVPGRSLFDLNGCAFSADGLLNNVLENSELMWTLVTKRDFGHVSHTLNVIATQTPYQWRLTQAVDPLKIREGESSILSLGEGLSNYVLQLAEFQREAHPEKWASTHPLDRNILAVDVIYQQLSPVVLNESEQRLVAERLTRHSDLFIGQSFAALDLKNAKGEARKFKVVFSSHSLSYLGIIAKVRNKKTVQEAAQKVEPLILRALTAVESGGFLIVYPASLHLLEYEGFFFKMLQKLKDQKLIADFVVSAARVGPGHAPGFFVVKAL